MIRRLFMCLPSLALAPASFACTANPAGGYAASLSPRGTRISGFDI